MEIRSLKELEKALKKKVQEAMEDNVAKTTKETMQEQVKLIVYDADNPTVYERRKFANGSLGDIESMLHKYDDKTGTLQVTNVADFNHEFARRINPDTDKPYGYGAVDMNKSLAYNIEYGYDSKEAWYNEPRPFVEKTRGELREGKFKDALRKGLNERGIKAE